MVNNDNIHNDIECPRCYGNNIKQLPATWNDAGLIAEYYSGFFFCTDCGGRLNWNDTEQKGTA